MTELKFCRICLSNEVRMHPILGSEVQDVYEKLSNKKVQEDGGLYFACYICYCQLKKCQQLVIKSMKSEKLLQQIMPIINELNLTSFPYLDRLTYGLGNSLMVVNTEPVQIPENKIVKVEDQSGYNVMGVTVKVEHFDESDINDVCVKVEKCDDSDINEVIAKDGHFDYTNNNDAMIKNEPYDENDSDVIIENYCYDGSPNKKGKLGEKCIIENDEIIEFETKANTYRFQRKRKCNEKWSSPTLCEETSSNVKDKQNFICNDCDKTFDRKNLLIKHIRRHKSGKDVKVGEWICDGRFTETNHMKIKLRNLTYKKPIKGIYCDYSSAGSSDLSTRIIEINRVKNTRNPRHRKHTTVKKCLKCPYCNYTTAQNGALTIHIRTHTGEKPFKCEICDYRSTQASHLKIHMRTHTGEKSFKCQYCNYTCGERHSLTKHMRSHTGEKPFKCKYCTFTCSDSSNLINHTRTHTKEKPYKCQYCDHKSAESSSLKKHIRIHTGEKPYTCGLCDKKYRQSGLLKRHIERAHTEKIAGDLI